MWRSCTERRYYEMLEVLPPALWLAKGFLVGEPTDHRTCTVRGHIAPTYAAFVSHGGKFYEGPSMTEAEFRAFDPKILEAGHA